MLLSSDKIHLRQTGDGVDFKPESPACSRTEDHSASVELEIVAKASGRPLEGFMFSTSWTERSMF